MADNKEVGETISRGSEWEVVSLTASAYAAYPGPKKVDLNDGDKENTFRIDDTETSHAMIMSGHFSFPPRQVDQFLMEDDKVIQIQNECKGEGMDPEWNVEEGGISSRKNEEDWDIKELIVADEFPGIGIFDEKGSKTSTGITELGASTAHLDDKIQNLYSAVEFSYSHKEASVHRSTTEFDETKVIPELIEPSEQDLDVSHSKPTNDEKFDESQLPCEAWWKRQAVSLYSHAKEANAFWSILIAAAVMGLAVLGQRWQQEKWQILQLKWQFSVNIENPGRMLGPIYRLKDVFVGGSRRGSSIRSSSSSEN